MMDAVIIVMQAFSLIPATIREMVKRKGFVIHKVSTFYLYTCSSLTCALNSHLCDKVCQLLAHGRWFSPGTPASATTKTGRHDIVEILLIVTLNTINQIILGMIPNE